MFGDVIPSFYSPRRVDDDGDGLSNIRLRPGEIQAVFGPKHSLNVSKKRNEYQVFVTHRANGTIVTKMYEHCFLADSFGSFADFIRFTLRADTSARRNPVKPGVGAKVIVACLNGESQNPVIISGIPDAATPVDDEADGHHFDAVFNGVEFNINAQGELLITYGGATNADATLADGVDRDAVGTTIVLQKNGNVKVADVDGKNTILLDHENSQIVVTGDKVVTANAPEVNLGGTGGQPVPKGDDWKSLMSDLISAIEQIQVYTAVGLSSPPVNAPALEVIKAQLGTVLSTVVFTQ